MKAKKTNQEQISFDGKFTAEIRKRLQMKRLQLGLPYQRVASLLSTNWSTVRKWETGPTINCSITLRPRLEDFLNGKLDKQILLQQNDPLTGSYPQHLPENALRCMEKLSHTYHILRYRPELRESMLSNMNKVASEVLQKMLEEE